MGLNEKNIVNNLRPCSKIDEIPKIWTQNKLPNTFVQNVKKSVEVKVREFGWQKIKRRCDINTKHVKLSDNVKNLWTIKLV